MDNWSRLFDAFRVSTSLCRFIFESPKVNDALLFMTILSTDLKALRRRGYNSMLLSKLLVLFGSLILKKKFTPIVDRILRQQKAEREAAEKAHRASLVSSSETLVQDTQTKIPTTGTMISPPPTSSGTATRQTTGTSLEQIFKRPTSAISDIGRLLRPNRPSTSSRATSPPRGDDATQSSILDVGGVSPPPNPKGALQPSNGQGLMRNPNTGGPHVTPLSNICTFRESDAPKRYLIFHSHLANNIDMAIKACAPERSNLLRNREEMQTVRETLDEGYCDVSGRAGELNFVGMCPVPLRELFHVSHHKFCR